MVFVRSPRLKALFLPTGAGLLCVGVAAATAWLQNTLVSPSLDHAVVTPTHTTGPENLAITRLKTYAQSVGGQVAPKSTPAQKKLPDVNTMIARLAKRLESSPNDGEGWRMLGWSYFNTARYHESAAAYQKAVDLNPNSDELKRALQMAKAKTTDSNRSVDDLSSPTGTSATAQGESGDETNTNAGAGTPPTQDPRIRAMVDGLAQRLARAPRDVAGWTRLMRSRVVLGERNRARTAFRNALDVFKDDSSASGKLMTAAIELGLENGAPSN